MCNLIIEETPDSGLAEEIQRSETIDAFTWGPHARTDSVSQEMTPSGSREDIVCLSEAEQDMRLCAEMLSSADCSTVAEQGEDALGSAPPARNDQLSSEPLAWAGVAITTCMEMDQPYAVLDSEKPAMGKVDLLKKGHEEAKISDGEIKQKQKVEDPMWECVDTNQKVDTEAIDTTALEDTEGFEEKVCDSLGNRTLHHLKTPAEQGQETFNRCEEGSRKDLRVRCEERLKTHENYFEKAALLGKDVERVYVADKLGDRTHGLSDKIQVIINHHKNIEGFEAIPANHAGICNLPLETDPVFIIKDLSIEEWELARKERGKHSTDPHNHSTKCHPAQGGAGIEEIQCSIAVSAQGADGHKSQSVVLSTKYSVAVESKIDPNCSLGTLASRKGQCSYKGKDSLTEGSASTVPENCSHAIKLPRTIKADSWGTDPGQIWQSSLNSVINDADIVGVSGIPDGQGNGFANWQEPNSHWPIRDIEGLHKCRGHLVESKKGLEVDLPADTCGKHARASGLDQSQETTRPLVQGTSWNTIMESPDSPRDNDINNSDLSEDEIANQRYGLLYQEIEADTDEVFALECSLD